MEGKHIIALQPDRETVADFLELLQRNAALQGADLVGFGRVLQSTIAAATTVCLKPEFRRQNLGESATEARRKYEACERKHGRER